MITRWLAESHAGVLTADGHDHAIVGVLVRPDRDAVVVYDIDKVVQGLVADGMDWCEAEEHVEYNVTGAYVGPRTPVFVRFCGPDWSAA